VLAVNYRGSAGRGSKFSRAIAADWGNYEVQDLLAGVDDGILIDGNGSFSIDQQRYNFQFGGDAFWSVKNEPWKLLRAEVIGRLSPVFIRTSAQKKSL